MNRYVLALISSILPFAYPCFTGTGYVHINPTPSGYVNRTFVQQGYKWKPKAEDPSLTTHTNLSTTDADADLKPKAPVNPCSHWYPGHRPFESPEVNNIANYMTTLPALRAYVDLRSYGQMSECSSAFLCWIVG